MKNCLLPSACLELIRSLFYVGVSFDVTLFHDDNLGVITGEQREGRTGG